MIVALLLLWSLVAVSLVRFLYKKQLKWAATAYGVLYIALTAWFYFLFVLDVAHLGLGVNKWSLWDASDIYDAFTDLYRQINALSTDLLYAVVFLAITVILSTVFYIVESSVQMAKDMYRRLGRNARAGKSAAANVGVFSTPAPRRRIYLTFCRLIS